MNAFLLWKKLTFPIIDYEEKKMSIAVSTQIKKETEGPVPVMLFMNKTLVEKLAQREIKRKGCKCKECKECKEKELIRKECSRQASYRYRIRKQKKLNQYKNERAELIERNLTLISQSNAIEKKINLFKSVIQCYVTI